MGCSYCTSCKTDLRFKSLQQVEKELCLLRQKGIREIRLLDRTFNFPPQRGKDLLKMFRLKFPEIKFHLEIHPQIMPPLLQDELLQALPGQLHLEAGIQSFNSQVQKAAGRNMNPKEALSGLRFLCSCKNFETHTDLLSGLPDQTLQSIYEDVEELLQTGPGEIQLEVLKVLPGTPLRKQAAQFGLCYNPQTPYDVMKSNAMSSEDILESRLLSRLLDLTYNHAALHPVMLQAARDQSCFLHDMLNFFIRNSLKPGRLFDLKKRFQLLDSFFHTGSSSRKWPSALDALAVQWIACGYPPGTGPAQNAHRTGRALPNTIVLESGSLDVFTEKETKVWQLETREKTYFFAFNRKYRANLPAAQCFEMGKNVEKTSTESA